jgi:Zn-dependent M28 family amino/carboxypeptidase
MAAPGADDNASGSAALLELLRALAAVPLQRTVRFVWFCGEEQGLIGSRAIAAAYAAEGAPLYAMVNADMLGCARRTPSPRCCQRRCIHRCRVQVHAAGRVHPDGLQGPLGVGRPHRVRDGVHAHVRRAIEPPPRPRRTDAPARSRDHLGISLHRYVGIPTGYSSSCCSDYLGFYEEGFASVGFFENNATASHYPQYHRSDDLATFVNFEQLELETKAIAATVAELAGVGAAPKAHGRGV